MTVVIMVDACTGGMTRAQVEAVLLMHTWITAGGVLALMLGFVGMITAHVMSLRRGGRR